VLRPDLVTANVSNYFIQKGWNPMSRWEYPEGLDENKFVDHWRSNQTMIQENMGVGFLGSLIDLSGTVNYLERRHKYLIVALGLDGAAPADRLAHILAHSGAVILIQNHHFEYHFSARLKPWEHYVPISYSTADLISKVLWLQKHDRLAFQLAKNARIFGLSYLRLEDFLCYDAHLLQTIASTMENSDATIPFDPVEI
jgi:hypothetical protein